MIEFIMSEEKKKIIYIFKMVEQGDTSNIITLATLACTTSNSIQL